MGVFYETIPPSLLEWIPQQKVFFVATAPLSGDGHVNVSPKGGPYFGLIGNNKFWYMDITGSGVETISHLYESGNARITIMFCAFEGAPKIVRLWGKGKVIERGTPQFDSFVEDQKVSVFAGTRSVITVDIHQVGSSCGFSVPFFDFKEYRTKLIDGFEEKAEKYRAGDDKQSMPRYWALKNSYSVDGLPGMDIALKTKKDVGVVPLKKMVGEAGNRMPYKPGANPISPQMPSQLKLIFSANAVGLLAIFYYVFKIYLETSA